jgi:hypothetical protein
MATESHFPIIDPQGGLRQLAIIRSKGEVQFVTISKFARRSRCVYTMVRARQFELRFVAGVVRRVGWDVELLDYVSSEAGMVLWKSHRSKEGLKVSLAAWRNSVVI